MRIQISHEFPVSPDVLWDLFDDPEFERRLGEASKVSREILDRKEDGGEEYKLTRCTSQRDYPALMKKALGGAEVVYDQETWLDRETNVLRWKITPHVLKGKIDASGTTKIEVLSSGCRRTISGDIKVNVPIVGGRVEKMIGGSVEESYGKAADIALEMLRERKLL